VIVSDVVPADSEIDAGKIAFANSADVLECVSDTFNDITFTLLSEDAVETEGSLRFAVDRILFAVSDDAEVEDSFLDATRRKTADSVDCVTESSLIEANAISKADSPEFVGTSTSIGNALKMLFCVSSDDDVIEDSVNETAKI
jgi:hypothetical protein